MADKTDGPDAADLEKQLAALREDFRGLTSMLRDMAGERAGGAAASARDSVDEVTREAARRGREARGAVEGAVHGNPLTALGVAALLGFALGAMSRR